jgi:branched-chain amino acid transport system ATP-binding protein
MSATPALQVEGLVKRFGGLIATDHASFSVAPGEVLAVIGPNGAGKTTLISQLAGELRPDAGRVLFHGRDLGAMPVHARAALGLARSYQITQVCREFTALQNVLLARQAHAGSSFGWWKPVLQQAQLLEPARAALARVGLAARADTPAADMAHGELRQLELAMVLVSDPKVLLLDEPMAGMSQAESEEMVALLKSLKGQYAMLLVEHDMDAVFALADRIAVLVYGKVIAVGTPEAIRNDAAVREAYLGEEGEVM